MRVVGWTLAAVATVGLGLLLSALGRRSDVTTLSPEARAEFDAAVDAQMCFYQRETRRHLERALEFDPDLVVAKVLLSDELLSAEPSRSAALMHEVRGIDLGGLSSRERLIVERALAIREGRLGDARRMLDRYLDRHPDDAWLLYVRADEAMLGNDYVEAEKILLRVLDVSPNWAAAYNALGYIAMRQGRFDEAEEYFKSYRFISPDQANPHDSLGELFLILGRLDEAEECFRQALSIKPDFWVTYEHLAMLHIMRRDTVAMRALAQQAGGLEGCPEETQRGLECVTGTAEMIERRQWLQLYETNAQLCLDARFVGYYSIVVTHLSACRIGAWEAARSIEDRLRDGKDDGAASGGSGDPRDAPLVLHLRAVRLAHRGRLEAAETRLRQADEGLDYANAETGVFRLYNKLLRVKVLSALGRDREAHRGLTSVQAINAHLAAVLEEVGLHDLGGRGGAT